MVDSPILYSGLTNPTSPFPNGPTISRVYGASSVRLTLVQLRLVGNSPSLTATLAPDWHLLGDYLVEASSPPSAHGENWVSGSSIHARHMYFWTTTESTGTITGTTNAPRWQIAYTQWGGCDPVSPFLAAVDTHAKTFVGTGTGGSRVWSPTFSDAMSVAGSGAAIWIFAGEGIDAARPRNAAGVALVGGDYLPQESGPITRTVTSSLYTGSSGALLAVFRTAHTGWHVGTAWGGSDWHVS